MSNEWDERYQHGDTPWEKGRAHPALLDFARLQPVHGRVLVPGCGHGHDARVLAASADEVIGLDIAKSAIKAAESYPIVGGEQYLEADLFDLPPRLRHRFDWVFEHTSFCAIDPERRRDYVTAVCEALCPGGHVLAIFFLTPEMDPGESGPPFGTTVAELDALFSTHFVTLGEWIPSQTFPGREGRELCRLLRLRH